MLDASCYKSVVGSCGTFAFSKEKAFAFSKEKALVLALFGKSKPTRACKRGNLGHTGDLQAAPQLAAVMYGCLQT